MSLNWRQFELGVLRPALLDFSKTNPFPRANDEVAVLLCISHGDSPDDPYGPQGGV